MNPKENLLNGKVKLPYMFALFEIICLWLFKSQYYIYIAPFLPAYYNFLVRKLFLKNSLSLVNSE